MKRSYWFKTLVIAFILVSFSCTTPTVHEEKEGGWKGCVIGFYPENGNETLSKGEIYEVDDFEEIIGQKVGSVVWFPTWTMSFQWWHVKGCTRGESYPILHGKFLALKRSK
jgi:hypothetical protein